MLEPFHGADYQTHQLHKLLKVEGRGRYENARVFRAVAQQLGISLLELSEVLHERNGSPHGYWTVAANEPTWESMRRGGHASLGWPNVGSLADLTYDKTSREALRQRVGATYPSDASKSIAKQLLDWATLAGERDLVAVVVGSMVRAVGRIVGSYSFEPEDVARPHHRAVEWLAVGDWALPETEGSVGDLCPVRKTPNILRLEASLLEGNGERPAAVPVDPPVVPVLTPLTGTVARIQAVLLRKRQVILHGPPGTGKTYWAERAVEELVARGWFGVDAASLGPERRMELVSAGAVELCSFHPAYGYEDFLEGYRPYEHNGALVFELRPGVFKRLCARARAAPTKPFYLVIDEINRGDIPRIFGELLTVLESVTSAGDRSPSPSAASRSPYPTTSSCWGR
ncbi:MAG: AAA family ATPase [Myxococcales bacterium]|nr:AAA family ATPase [Myxococcales bacterium]